MISSFSDDDDDDDLNALFSDGIAPAGGFAGLFLNRFGGAIRFTGEMAPNAPRFDDSVDACLGDES